MTRPSRLAAAATFILPLLILLAIWEAVVRLFDVSPRVFPAIEPVAQAGAAAIADGTLIRHIGASLGRVALGTAIGIVLAEVHAQRDADQARAVLRPAAHPERRGDHAGVCLQALT
jgi:ABC-type nitrate/sulfonate/bicarbonate transport system permease component